MKFGNKTCQTFCTEEGFIGKKICETVNLKKGGCYCKDTALRVESINQCITPEECKKKQNVKKIPERKLKIFIQKF